MRNELHSSVSETALLSKYVSTVFEGSFNALKMVYEKGMVIGRNGKMSFTADAGLTWYVH